MHRKWWTSNHTAPDCVEFMRRTLLDDLDDLRYDVPKGPEWKRATADAEVRFPTKRAIDRDGWGAWHDAVTDQVQHGSSAQIDAYYHDRYSECPVCGLGMEPGYF